MKNIILFCYAHPDDESFGSGGTIAKYAAREDTEVHLLCATRGEEGQMGNPPLCSRAELGALREQELLNAAQALGIKKVHFLAYRDKLLSHVSMKQLSLEVKTIIYELGAQVVITFPSHGISGHPDHKAIHYAVHDAVTNDRRTPVKKLYNQTIPASIAAHRLIPHSDPDERVTTYISCKEHIPQVLEALRAHQTQHDVIEKYFPGFKEGKLEDAVFAVNWFMLRWASADVATSAAEDDLLQGLPNAHR
ncbi:MAG: PIG-L deacetylase family protein [Paenibacillaceae bacterium]